MWGLRGGRRGSETVIRTEEHTGTRGGGAVARERRIAKLGTLGRLDEGRVLHALEIGAETLDFGVRIFGLIEGQAVEIEEPGAGDTGRSEDRRT